MTAPVGPPRDLLRYTFPVELGKVLEFRRALRCADAQQPDQQGQPDQAHQADAPTVVPLTFPVSGALWAPRQASPHALMIAAADFDADRTVLGEMRWVFHRRIEVGDQVSVRIRLIGVTEKTGRQAGSMRIATGETSYSLLPGETPLVTVQSDLIELRAGRNP